MPLQEVQRGITKENNPLIKFIRPGLILIKNEEKNQYNVEEGTVEFSNNKLLIVTSTAKDLKNCNKETINDLLDQAEKKLKDSNVSDKEKYTVSYKINTLKEISQ